MLMQMKSVTEGARVLVYETAIYTDLARHHPDAKVREEAADFVELNTPLVKAFCTDSAVELGSLAIQVYGGHGFIKEHGVEQIVRDSKILCLYEGTNGIQSMDLVRRKLMLHNGRLPGRFFAKARAAATQAKSELEFIGKPLIAALDDLEKTTRWIQESYKSSPDDAAFGCADFLRAFALTYLGYNWLRMATSALSLSDASRRQAKLATAHFFATRMLSLVPALLGNVRSPAAGAMQLDAASF
jgi:hypothetical protein